MKTFLRNKRFFGWLIVLLFIGLSQAQALVLRINGKSAPVPNDTLCLSLPDDDNNLALTGSAAGGPLPITYPNPRWTGSGAPFLSSTTTNITIFDPNLSGPGTFVVTFNAIDGVGITYSVSKTIIVDPAQTMSYVSPASGTADICAVGNITLQVSGAAEYYWYADDCAGGGYDILTVIGTGASINVTPAASGTCKYLVQGFSALGCPTDPAELEFTINAGQPPTVDAGSDRTICSGETVTLNGSIGGTATSAYWSGGTGTYTPNNSTLNAVYTPSAAERAAGTVTLRLNTNDPPGPCDAAFDEMTITINPVPTASAGGNKTICAGDCITLTATGGPSYLWSTGSTTSTTNVCPPNTASYTVTVTNAFGCSASDRAVVTVNPLPVVTVNNPTICEGQSTTLTATGGPSYSWNTGATTATITVNPVTTTTYTVTVTVSGCSASENGIVTVNAKPTITILPNAPVVCAGSCVTLTASGGTSYVWSGGGTGSTKTVCPVVNTTYTVTVTNAAGCTGSSSIGVTANALPDVDAGPNQSICPGFSATLTATSAAATSYAWSSGTNCNAGPSCTTTVMPAAQTTYTVTVTNAAGCTASDNVVVSLNPPAVANAGSDVTICAGQSTVLTATGSPGSSYVWSSGTTCASASSCTTTVSPATTTTYTVTVTNSAGCTGSDNVVVTVNALPTPPTSASVDRTYFCTDDAGTITLSASGGSGTTLRWYRGGCGTTFVGSGTPLVINSPTTTTLYYVRWENSCGNSTCITVNVPVVQQPQPATSASVDRNNFCFDDPGNIVLSASGGTGTFVWYTGSCGGTLIGSGANITIPSPVTTTTYYVGKRNVCGISTCLSVVVNVQNPPVAPTSATSSRNNFCADDAGNITLSAAGGSGTTLNWYTGSCGGTLIGTGNNLIIPSPDVTITYYAAWSNSCGISTCASTVVNVVTLPSASAGADKTICSGNCTSLTATGGPSYLWNGGQTTAVINVCPVATTTYTVTVTVGGCSASDDAVVYVNPLPPASAGADQTICSGTCTNLTASGAGAGGSYVWNGGQTTATINVCPLVTTTYTVTATDVNGCSASDEVIVAVSAPAANAGADVTSCSGAPVTLTATGGGVGGSYSWNVGPPNTNPITVYPTVTTTYTVTVTDVASCTATDDVVVTIQPLAPPTSITVDRDNFCTDDAGNITLSAHGGSGTIIRWYTVSCGTNFIGSGNPISFASPTTTTTYWALWSSPCGNTTCASVTVNVVQQPVAPTSASVDRNNFCTTDAGNITLSASGGSGGTYEWYTGSCGGTLIGTGTNLSIESPVATTTYYVAVRNVCGLSSCRSVVVNVVNSPVPPATASATPNTYCSADVGNITLSASGGSGDLIYWYTGSCAGTVVGSGNPLIIPHPVTTTTYYAAWTNACGPSSCASAVVTINPSPTANAGADVTICSGNCTILTATGGPSYAWSNGTNTNTNNVCPLVTTTYTVTVTVGGCSSSDNVIVTVNTTPTPNITSTPDPMRFCIESGDTAFIQDFQVGVGPRPFQDTVNYTFFTPGATITSINDIVGVYVNMEHSYLGDLSFEIKCPPPANNVVILKQFPGGGATFVGEPVSVGIPDANNADLTKGNGYDYWWKPNPTYNTMNWEAANNPHYYTYTDNSGNLHVNRKYLPSGSYQSNQTLAGLIGCPLNGNWIFRGADNMPADNGNIFGWGLYLRPDLYNDYTQLTATPPGGVWSGPGIVDAVNGYYNPVVAGVGTNYVYYCVTNNGCTGCDSIQMIVSRMPIINAGPDRTICAGNSVTIDAGGGGNGYSYIWNTTPPQTTQTITVSPAVTTTYIVTATSTNLCQAIDTVVVFVNPLPPASAGPDRTICAGDCITLTATGGGSYTWNIGGSNPRVICPGPMTNTTYTVTVTLNGCSASDDVAITVNPLPVVGILSDPTPAVVCRGSAVTLTATGANSYTWAPATGLSSTTGSIVIATPTVTTTYTVTGTNATGCSGTSSIVVTINPLPTITINPSAPNLCFGSSVTLTASGANSYTWSPATGLNTTTGNIVTANPTTTTTYTVTGTDAFGCTGSNTVVVTTYPQLIVNAGADIQMCNPAQGGTATLGGSPTASGGSGGGYTYTWSATSGTVPGNEPNPTVIPNVTTTYCVTVTDGNNCSASDCIVVIVGSPLVVNPGPQAIICLRTSHQLGSANPVSGGTPPYTYLWTSNPPDPSLVGQETLPNPLVTPTVTTTYTLTATDANLCQFSRTVRVTIHEPIVYADAGADGLICNGSTGGTFTLGGSPTAIGGTAPFDYMWTSNPPDPTLSGQETTSNPVVSPTVTTTYYLYLIDAEPDNCPAWDTIVVGVLPPLTVTASVSNPNICAGSNGGSTTITANPVGGTGSGYTFSWSPALGLSSTTGNPVTATPNVTTTYTVTVSNGPGCSASTTAVVNVYPVLLADAGADKSICAAGDPVTLGGSPTASGGTPPYVSYTWSSTTVGEIVPPTANPVVNPMVNTTYCVTITDSHGCSATDCVTISLNPVLIAEAGNNRTICPNTSTTIGGSPTASGGSGSGYTYNWVVTPVGETFNTTEPNPVVNPTVTSTYCLTVTDASGCTATDCVTISLNPALFANAGIDDSLCNVHPPKIIGGPGCTTASGGTPPYTYTWASSTGVVVPNVCNPLVNPTVTTTYYVTVTDFTGCVATDSMVLYVMPPLVVNAGTFNICNWGDTVCLGGTPTATGGCGQYTYNWVTTPTGGLRTEANPCIISHPDTTWAVFVFDACCPIPGYSVASITPTSTLSITPWQNITLCAGRDTAIGATVTGATSSTTYSWTSVNGYTSNNLINPIINPTVSDTYTLVVTDVCGSETTTLTITVLPVPIKPFGNDSITCQGNTVVLDANPLNIAGYTYLWNPGGATTETISVTSTGQYDVLVGNGYCSTRDTIVVTFNPLPTVNLGVTDTITLCSGADTLLDAGSCLACTYSWSNGATTQTVRVGAMGTYTVTVTNNCGSAVDSVYLNVLPAPLAYVIPDDTICYGASINIGGASTPGHTYSWSPASSLDDANIANPLATPTITTTYTLTETLGSCIATNSVVITVNRIVPSIAVTVAIDTCGATNAVLTASATGGYAPLNYIWNNGETTAMIDSLGAGTYCVTVSDFMCSNSTCETLNDPGGPVINLTSSDANDTICANDIVTFTTTVVVGTATSYEYFINGVSVQGPNLINTLTIDTLTVNPSIIQVVVKDAQGCSSNMVDTLTVYPSPFAYAGRDTLICANECVQIGSDSIAGLTYNWTSVPVDPNFIHTNYAKPTVCPSDTIKYILTVTSTYCGTSMVDTVEVFVKPSPFANIGPSNLVCLASASDSVQLGAAPVTGNIYTWSSMPMDGNFNTNIANPWVKPIVTTTYTLVVYNADGCSDMNTVVVNPPMTVNVSITNPSSCGLCDGVACVTVTGGTGVYTYTWSNGDNIACADTLCAIIGNYFVTVSDGLCNPVVVPIRIIDPNASSVSLNITAGNDTLCSGECVTFTATVTNSAPTDTLMFYVNGIIVAGPDVATTFTSCNLNDGDRVWVVVKNALGCYAPSFESYLMKVYPTPTANAGNDSIVCANTPIVIGNNVFNPDYIYTWSSNPPSVFNTSDPNPLVNPTITTTYSLTVSANGFCPSTDQIIVKVERTLTADVIPNSYVCSGNSINIGFDTPSAGGPFTYSWTSDPGGFTSTLPNPSVTPVVTTTYYLTQSDLLPNTCDRLGSVVITVNPVIGADAGLDTVICLNRCTPIGIGIDSIAGLIYHWSASPSDPSLLDTAYAKPIVCPTVTTTYTLMVDYAQGACNNNAIDQMVVNVSDIKVFGNDTLACIGRAVPHKLGSTPLATGGHGGYTYLWNGPNNFTANIANPYVFNFNDSITKVYTVTVTDAYGCVGTGVDSIKMLKRPFIKLKSDKQNNVMYDASQVVTFIATPIGLPKYEFYVDGQLVQSGTSNTYKIDDMADSSIVSVVVRNLDDCIAIDSVLMRVKVIPNAFTPNGDGVNDIFMPTVDLKVLNRWGQTLYEGTEGWDGTYKGRKVSPGTYFVIVKFYDLNNVETVYRGTVLVVGDK